MLGSSASPRVSISSFVNPKASQAEKAQVTKLLGQKKRNAGADTNKTTKKAKRNPNSNAILCKQCRRSNSSLTQGSIGNFFKTSVSAAPAQTSSVSDVVTTPDSTKEVPPAAEPKVEEGETPAPLTGYSQHGTQAGELVCDTDQKAGAPILDNSLFCTRCRRPMQVRLGFVFNTHILVHMPYFVALDLDCIYRLKPHLRCASVASAFLHVISS
jgi:hypothetical protein